MGKWLPARGRGCLIGLAVGDAVGTTVEFQSPSTFAPLTDLVGGGPFNLEPGQWTDDTSMALCLATSLVECHGFDAHDQMERYCRWWYDGYLSSNGRCFDIGNTVAAALIRFVRTTDPFAGSLNPQTAGNGCLMRLAPVPLYYFPDADIAAHYAIESTRTTHGAPECLDASALFARQLCRALAGESKEEILLGERDRAFASPKVAALARGEYGTPIRGTGYVIASLEAALWSFATTESFSDAILRAANLGDDADTTAAICGQLAGAHYGIDTIPAAWQEKLAHRETITALTDALGKS